MADGRARIDLGEGGGGMTHSEFIQWLETHDACEPAITWAKEHGYTPEQAWERCERGDWLAWWYFEAHPEDERLQALVGGHIANTVRHLMTDERSTKAVDMAIAYGEGRATREECKEANEAAVAVAINRPDDSASWSAASASWSAASASASAWASAWASENKAANQRQTADICRKFLTCPLPEPPKE